MVYIRLNVPKEVKDAISSHRLPQKDLIELIKHYYSQQVASPQASIIDSMPADNGASMPQERWIKYFNNERKRMISAPDVYTIGQNGTSSLTI